MIALLCLWFGISFPLVFVGFFFGYRKHPYEHPVRTNQIPRQIPEQPWYLNLALSSVVAGILPFGAIFVELFFILTVSDDFIIRYIYLSLTLKTIIFKIYFFDFIYSILKTFIPIFNPLGYLGKSVLLLVWLLVSRLRYPYHCLCRGCHSDDILPVVC